MREFIKFFIIFIGGIWTICLIFLSNIPLIYGVIFGILAASLYKIVDCLTIKIEWNK